MPQGEKSKYRQDVSIGHGKRQSVYAATKSELKRKVARLITQVEQGTVAAPNKATVEQVATQWLPFHATEKEISDSTYLSYDQVLKSHVIPLFGKLQIQRLNEHVITQKMAHRDHLSSSMRRKIMLTLHLVIKYARRLKIITQDPMEFLSLPSQRNETDREMFCMNQEQVQLFHKACSGTRFENLFILALATGAREGELLALRKTDFVQDYSVMRVRRTLSDDKDGNPQVKNQPKSAAGRRDVPLPKFARNAVLSEVKWRLKEGRQSHSLFFSTSEGTPHHRRNILSRHFRPLLKDSGLPTQMRFHDLRHTYATLALNAGVGVHLVSKMLGHASVKITIDLYGHALPDATADAAQTMHKVLAPPSKKRRSNA